MNYGNIKFIDSADGPGVRVSLFVSGCRNHCEGCFSPMTWDFNYGKSFTDIELNEIIEALKKPYIKGLTILGGEPFEEENQPEVLRVIEKVRETFGDTKDIWMFSGYYLEELRENGRKYVDGVTDKILDSIDTIVEGPFILAERDITLQFRGSRNQKITRLS